MLCSYVYCVPTATSLQQLKNVFDGAPFDIPWDQLQLEIFISDEHLNPDIAMPYSGQIYSANILKMDLWMNMLLGGSSLIMALDSPQLVERNLQYSKFFNSAFTTSYYPHLTILNSAPQLKRSITGFLSNAATSLIENSIPLEFTSESIVHVDFKLPPDLGFIESMELNQDGDNF